MLIYFWKPLTLFRLAVGQSVLEQSSLASSWPASPSVPVLFPVVALVIFIDFVQLLDTGFDLD